MCKIASVFLIAIILLNTTWAQESIDKKGIWGSGVQFNFGLMQFKTKQINQAISIAGVQGRLPSIHLYIGTEATGYLGKFYFFIGSNAIMSLTNMKSEVNSQGFFWFLGGGYFLVMKEKFGVATEIQLQFHNLTINVNNPRANVTNTFTPTLLTTNNMASFNLTNQSIFLGLNLGMWGSNQPMWGFKLGTTITYNTKWKYSGQNIVNAPSYMPFGFVCSVYFMI